MVKKVCIFGIGGIGGTIIRLGKKYSIPTPSTERFFMKN
jgi:hypothetical protein